jgi:NAD-dependent protein deacetylase/lipoamidase sirtuin 4
MPVEPEIDSLAKLLENKRLVVLTGAGCSTESGIPDYRGPETARRARNPMRFSEFIRDENSRRRYWARSMHGWPRVAGAEPNPAHAALAELEARGQVVGVITQNVDGLHRRAGSQRLIELHGRLDQVRCLDCGALEPRRQLQERLLANNPGWQPRAVELAPDGDAEVDQALERFRVAVCRACAGALKPNVVFFGEHVPAEVVADAYDLLGSAEALLVVGSSLVVFSGYRFVRRAAERGLPVAIVNLSPTRADPLATVTLAQRAGTALPALARALDPRQPRRGVVPAALVD